MLSRLRKFRALPVAQRRLQMRAFRMVMLVRSWLVLLPFATVRHLVRQRLERSGSYQVAVENNPDTSSIVLAVERAGRIVPGATCLTQAVALRILLADAGHSSRLHIGVARSSVSALEAHAWVEQEGQIILGDIDLNNFTRLSGDEIL